MQFRGSIVALMLLSYLIMPLACAPDHRPPPTTTTNAASSGVSPAMHPTEGMWLPTALPADRLEGEFGFEPSAAWAEHLQLSSVKIGASGAFVSADGLVLTNHHVAAGRLQDVSRAGRDYLANGLLARSRDQEIPLPGMELGVLFSIEDVTAKVKAAVDEKLPPAEAVKARRAILAQIERESLDRTKLQSNVVTLYGGALYHLYRYKRYTDVRAVFAPEKGSAFFGGDPDNFEYPRFDLDVALLRAYEDGRPAKVEHYLRLAPGGVADGELVFVSGHPGRTDRLLPVAVLEGMRDETMPLRIERLERIERAALEYGRRGPEQGRQAQQDIFGVQNGLKASRPRLAALRTYVITQKQREEQALRDALRQRPDLRGYDAAWDRIAAAERQRHELFLREAMLEGGDAFGTKLFRYARDLVRLAAEDQKPDARRLPEYSQSNRKPLEHRLFADEPVYADLEIAKLTATLQFFRERLGADSAGVKQVLAGKPPSARAAELVSGSRLGDAAERRRIRDGGAAAIESSNDPMIVLARQIDPAARQVREAYEAKVEEPQTQALGDVNRARFALLGAAVYPDATGTLRFAFGVVRGYEQDGRSIPPWTTIGGAFRHEQSHGGRDPYALPASWHKAHDALKLDAPLNFVCTADITGGNSGSPVVNRKGELVGVIFDSNRQGVANDFIYTDDQARAVAVDVRGIFESLRAIYGAEDLVRELMGDR